MVCGVDRIVRNDFERLQAGPEPRQAPSMGRMTTAAYEGLQEDGEPPRKTAMTGAVVFLKYLLRAAWQDASAAGGEVDSRDAFLGRGRLWSR